MEDKLIIIKEYKLFINRYEKLVINLNNNYKDIKARIINTMYSILEDIYYTNLLDLNKRKNFQRKIIVKINSSLITILKLLFGWMK